MDGNDFGELYKSVSTTVNDMKELKQNIEDNITALRTDLNTIVKEYEGRIAVLEDRSNSWKDIQKIGFGVLIGAGLLYLIGLL